MNQQVLARFRKAWMYLYRAVDAFGNPLEFLLRPTREAQAATGFCVKAVHSTAGSAQEARRVQEQGAQPQLSAEPTTTKSAPRVINVAKNAASPKAMAELKAAGILPQPGELRQVNYLTTLIEQDHRFIKRLVKPGMGFFSLETAGRTLQGDEVMHMLRKGQVSGVGKGDLLGQVCFIAHLFAVAASAEQEGRLPVHRRCSRVCATQPPVQMGQARIVQLQLIFRHTAHRTRPD